MSVVASTTVFDSLLFRDAFGTERMRAVFSDLALVERSTEVEIALARAAARCGGTPAGPANETTRRCAAAAPDLKLPPRQPDNLDYPSLPLVHQLAKQCGEAGRY